MKTTFFTALLSVFGFGLMAQANDTTPRLRISGYVDAYYGFFTDSLGPNALQQVTTVSPRDQRIGLNVAQIGLHYEAEKIRGNVIFHHGDIIQATWSSEFPAVQEANFGFRLAKGWWIDGGFFATHIGTESFLPKNDFLSSTVVATYNEPFYQAGARLSYEGSEKFHGELWVTNGYNLFLDVNSPQSVGVLLSYNFNDETSITYTNLLGIESLDGAPLTQYRTYHNLYLNTQFGKKVFLVLGGDLGTQTNSDIENPEENALMYNALATLRYQFNPKFSITGRGEIFQDPEGFISGTYLNETGSPEGLQLWGITLGTEYRPTANSYIRPEVRYLKAEDDLPIFNNDFDRTARWEAMITMGFYFDKVLNKSENAIF